jgi:hypothetical protein
MTVAYFETAGLGRHGIGLELKSANDRVELDPRKSD